MRPAAPLALVFVACLVAASAAAQAPRFNPGGPEAELYGRAAGYPVCQRFDYIDDLGCRVGAFSNMDRLFPARAIKAPAAASPLRRAAAEPAIRYDWNGESRTIDRFLETNHVTGLLIARGDTILVERYQYGRDDRHRLTSYSMAKTVIGLLVGIAAAEGAIRSIDDTADAYAPALKGTEYGRTPIKALLQMASGVTFGEVYTDRDSDVHRFAMLTTGQDPIGTAGALRQFDRRHAEPGKRFAYSTAESSVLGLVVAGATRRTVADYAAEKLWGPLGAEADASWIVDATGQEVTFAFLNAVLRDWARLGLMLAHDGAWQGRQVVPRQWVLDSTAIQPDSPMWSASMTPGRHAPGYGYQTWLLLAKERTFALRGLRGQWVIVEPQKKLVLVQTSLRDGADQELMALWAALAASVP